MCGIRKLGTLPLCVGFALLAILGACAYSKACDPVVGQSSILRLESGYAGDVLGCHQSQSVLRLVQPHRQAVVVEHFVEAPVRERLVIRHPIVERQVVVQSERQRGGFLDRLRNRRAEGAQRRADSLAVKAQSSRSRSVQRVVVRSH